MLFKKSFKIIREKTFRKNAVDKCGNSRHTTVCLRSNPYISHLGLLLFLNIVFLQICKYKDRSPVLTELHCIYIYIHIYNYQEGPSEPGTFLNVGFNPNTGVGVEPDV